MSAIPTIMFSWDGEAMVPKIGRMADRHFVVGMTYPLAVNEARSRESHNHFFAAVEDGWRNLPEHLAEHFPTSEHLRKYALIKAGFCDSSSTTCASKAEAERIAAFIRPIDEFSIVTVSEATVTRYSAKSQSLRAMGRKVFQDSKQAVLDIIAGMIGVKASELQENAEKAA